MTDSEALIEIRDLLQAILGELRQERPKRTRKLRPTTTADITDLDQARAERILQRLRTR
jgi:hypothetical protein